MLLPANDQDELPWDLDLGWVRFLQRVEGPQSIMVLGTKAAAKEKICGFLEQIDFGNA